MRQLILGGARSGKSALAERLALALSPSPLYLATATADDQEMLQRVQHHRERRGDCWRELEEPLALGAALHRLDGPDACVLVDCLTLWLTNCLLAPDPACWPREREAFLAAAAGFRGQLLLVSNETGLGVVPMGELSRRFVDESGRLHQALAQLCERVVLTVAGLPLVLKGEGI